MSQAHFARQNDAQGVNQWATRKPQLLLASLKRVRFVSRFSLSVQRLLRTLRSKAPVFSLGHILQLSHMGRSILWLDLALLMSDELPQRRETKAHET